jgi:uncharacterized Zn-finger protein
MKKCGRCHSTLLEEYFDSSRKGELKKCCRGCLKTHKCPTCDKDFTTKQSLQKHISEVHLKEKTYKCPTCDKSFGQYVNLQTHIKSQHLQIKDFKCLECDYCSSESGHLQTHIKTVHHKIKKHKCPDCDQSFGENGNLQKHIKSVHLNIKDFKCPDCDHCCSRNEHLQTHIKICTGTRKCSSGEFAIMKALDSLGFKEHINYFYNQSYDNVRDKLHLRFDFRLETSGEPIFIEFDGRFHYFPIRNTSTTTPEAAETNFASIKKHDKIKDDYCNDNGLLLLRIPYWEQNNINKIVSDFLEENTV